MQHAVCAAKYSTDLVIKSPDTDVFVLALAFCSHIDCHLYFHTAKERNPHIADINSLHAHMASSLEQAVVCVMTPADTLINVQQSRLFLPQGLQRPNVTQ